MALDDNYNNDNRLLELGGSDFEIADNEPDIRGWTVKDDQGKTIGEVDELIFDPQSRKVRYLVLDLEGNVLDLESRDVLVPIGLAELDQSDDDVFLPGITAAQLNMLPTYEKNSITRETETLVRTAFSGLGAAGVAGAAYAGSSDQDDREDFYNHDHYNEDNLYRRRNTAATTDNTSSIPVIEEQLNIGKEVVETGGARIRSRIVERPVEENLSLREEHINVERREVNRPASEGDLATFQEGTIEITEHAEVPVVSKEARVVEEIALNKQIEEREEVIRDTVRSTDVEVERLDSDEKRLNTDETNRKTDI